MVVAAAASFEFAGGPCVGVCVSRLKASIRVIYQALVYRIESNRIHAAALVVQEEEEEEEVRYLMRSHRHSNY